MIDFARVQKELQECSRDMEASGIKVAPKSDNLARLTGTIPGPISSPYEGGTFQIDITLPGNILETNTSIQGVSVFVYVLEILYSWILMGCLFFLKKKNNRAAFECLLIGWKRKLGKKKKHTWRLKLKILPSRFSCCKSNFIRLVRVFKCVSSVVNLEEKEELWCGFWGFEVSVCFYRVFDLVYSLAICWISNASALSQDVCLAVKKVDMKEMGYRVHCVILLLLAIVAWQGVCVSYIWSGGYRDIYWPAFVMFCSFCRWIPLWASKNAVCNKSLVGRSWSKLFLFPQLF
jgi:hypothetical protein